MRIDRIIAEVRSAGQVSALALAVVLGWLVPARGVELDNDGLSREDTVAYKEHLRRWDNLTIYNGERVVDRSKQPYQPDGIRIGNYILSPSLGVETTFDDNIFASRTNRKSDVRVDVVPVVKLTSQFSRHALDFAAGGRIARYAEHDSYDHAEGFVTMAGALHFDHAHTLSFRALSQIDHDDSLVPDKPTNAREPTQVLHNSVAVGLKRDAGRLWGALGAKAESWNYRDVRAFDGSVIDQDERDLQVVSTNARIGYRFSPGYEAQVQVRGLRQTTPGNVEYNRDAVGWEVAAGLAAELNPLLRWRLFGGYAQRDFDRKELGTVGAAIAEAELQWLASSLWNLTLTARRELNDSANVDGANARIDNKLKARVDYEMLRNLVFTIQGEYRLSDYVGVDRTDHLYVGRVGLQYLHTKNLMFQLNWENQQRLSDIAEAEFTRNRFWFEGKLRF